MKWLDALGVSESYQVPDAMMKALGDPQKRHELFERKDGKIKIRRSAR